LAYVAYTLGRLGDTAAIDVLKEQRARLSDIEPKDEWDYAALGQTNEALNSLTK